MELLKNKINLMLKSDEILLVLEGILLILSLALLTIVFIAVIKHSELTSF